jgi:hypothetical protein
LQAKSYEAWNVGIVWNKHCCLFETDFK